MSNTVMPMADEGMEYTFGPFRFVPARRLLLHEDMPRRVGGRALDILALLLERSGEPVNKRELIARAWPKSVVEEGNLKVHVAALRRTLGDGDAGSRYIATVNGRGYCFVAPVRCEAQAKEAAADQFSAFGTPGLTRRLGRTIGRDATIATMVDMLKQRRLVSIVGPGGIGKTTVALAVAETFASMHGIQVRFVDLGSLADPKFLPGALAAALNLGLPAGDAGTALVAALRGARVMLILDSCEHVIDAVAVLSGQIVAAAPAMRIVCTSREPLRADGEYVHRLAALDVPEPHAAPSAAQAMSYSAVELFVERAAEAVEGFELLDADAGAVIDICRRLEGIALAIELAATRVDAFSPRELALRLDDRFHLLERGHRSAQARHRTLSNALDWSYVYLSASEQVLFRALAVFAGPFTIDAVMALCQDEGNGADPVSDLADLVAKSLLSTDLRAPVSHYRMLDTTKAYALDKLEEHGETARVRQRHARAMCAIFQRAAVEWEGSASGEWIVHYGKGIDDLRSALAWSMSGAGDSAIGIMLTVAAIPLWTHLSLLEECRVCVERALDAGERQGFPTPQDEMKLQTARAAAILYACGPLQETEVAWSRTLALAEALDDAEYQLRALWGLAVYQCYSGDYRQVLALSERFRQIAADKGDRAARVSVERLIATALHYMGDQDGARSHLEHMLSRWIQPVQRSHIARFQLDQRAAALGTMANVLWIQGYPDRAVQAASEALQTARDVNHPLSVLNTLAHAACPVYFYVGDWAEAERLLGELHEHLAHHGLGMWNALWRCLRGVMSIKRGDVHGAQLLQDALDDLRCAGFRLRLPGYLGILAHAQAALGQLDEAAETIVDALACCEVGGEYWCVPELLRIHGTLLERSDRSAAERLYRDALAQARRGNMLSWELRAALSLARLRRTQGRGEEGLRELAEVYGRFTEGYRTHDLLLARAAIEADAPLLVMS